MTSVGVAIVVGLFLVLLDNLLEVDWAYVRSLLLSPRVVVALLQLTIHYINLGLRVFCIFEKIFGFDLVIDL